LHFPQVFFIQQLIQIFKTQLIAAKENLFKAAKEHPVHGILICLQYILADLDFGMYNGMSIPLKIKWRQLITNVLNAIYELLNIVLGVLSNSSPGKLFLIFFISEFYTFNKLTL